MIGKIVSVVIVVLILVSSGWFIYDNLPGEAVEMRVSDVVSEPSSLVSYGAVPVFSDRLRFNHNDISFSIERSCAKVRRDAMIEAFGLFADEVGLISFHEVGSGADIKVGCSDDYIELGENLFAAGEGGPSRIINTSGFKLIEEGKVWLYDDPRCDYPIVELHELGHVFGFDHSADPKNIMYNTSGCDQRISEDMVELIKELYSIEALADVLVKDVAAVLKGKYLDFNVTVLNEGLVGVGAVDLTVLANGGIVDVVKMGEIDVGFGRTLRVTNLKLPSRGVDVIEFVVDRDDEVRELDEGNNVVEMVV
jgi:hypothetical protein